MSHRTLHVGRGRAAAVLLFTCCLVGAALAVPPDAAGPEGANSDADATVARASGAASRWTPKVEPASEEAELAISQFRLPPGFKVELFAAEPRLANPVAFHIDDKGRFYVVETYRFKHGVIDVRDVMDWLDDDTASRTVADRVAMVRKFRGDAGVQELSVAADRLKLIEDRDGDGKADFDSVFGDSWNRIEDGVASGVLARANGDVYFANVPSLYLLRDKDGDGRADEQKVLHYGYGVRYAYLGHDLHGLVFGPDGKLYFSVGDRGLNIEKSVDGRLVQNPDSGAVLRCNPDGTELELVHTGLRNPQELAFDQYGNLFTGDNNCDGGDLARWVHVVEGGDSGWRIGYQHQEFPMNRGPWNSERLWDPQTKTPAYHILPPLANLKASGPSGLTYNPGTGMPAKYANSFFLADFRGGPSGSGIYQMVNKPRGATFEVEQTMFVSDILPTDVDFGPDGAMYYTDWTAGWDLPGKGRIYRISEPGALKDPVVAEVKQLLAEDFTKRTLADVVRLLEHRDMRVRQKAQFELAGRGAEPIATLTGLAKATEHAQLARIHAMWALGQIDRRAPGVARGLVPLLSDRDPEIRAQAAKVLGDGNVAEAFDGLVKLLEDDSPRVRFFAAMGLGKLGRREATPAVLKMIEANDDRDPYLRHAGVMAMIGINDPDPLRGPLSQAKPAARMATVLALRRLKSSHVAQFLSDPDPRIVLEAARAINDEPIEAAMPKLAALIGKAGLADPVLMRVINANYRVGSQAAAEALAAFAARNDAPAFFRADALDLLAEWRHVPGRNHVTGVWNPLPDRDPQVAARAVEKVLPQILRTAPDVVRVAAAGLAQKIGADESPVLLELVAAKNVSPQVRAAALNALAGRNDPQLADAIRSALTDPDEAVRLQAIKLQARLPDGAQHLGRLLTDGTVPEQQAVLAALAAAPHSNAAADQLVAQSLDRLLAGKVPAEVRLDVLDAASKRRGAQVQEKVKQYEATLDKNDPLAEFTETLAGGDVEKGRKIFLERADVSCLKCHRIQGEGGNAGPDLAGVGAKYPPRYFLESILLPAKQIAQGWETVIVRLKNGDVVSGVLRSETDDELRLEIVDANNPNATPKPLTIAKKDIDKRRGGQSAMPEGLGKTLKKQDLRNLVAFLSSLKDPPAGE